MDRFTRKRVLMLGIFPGTIWELLDKAIRLSNESKETVYVNHNSIMLFPVKPGDNIDKLEERWEHRMRYIGE